MAHDFQTVMEALRRADAAGAVDDAKRLAQILDRMRRGESPEQTPQGGGIGASFKRGVEQFISTGRTAAGATFGDEKAAMEASLQRQQAISEKYGQAPGWEEVKKAYQEKGLLPAIGEYARQIPGALAEQAPQIGASMASARLGATAGPAGAIAGATVPSYTQAYGALLEREAEEQRRRGEPVDVSKTGAALRAVPYAALDVAATYIPLGKSIVKSIFGEDVAKLLSKGATKEAELLASKKLASEGFWKAVGKGTVKGVAVEAPTEIGQQMLERSQAGLSLFDEDAMAEYGKTAFEISKLGPLGGVGRLSDRSAARMDVARAEAEDAAAKAKAAQEEEAVRKADPKYLLGLGEQYDAMKAKLADMQKQLKENKPGKEATEGQQDAYAGLQRDYKAAIEEFKPLKQEYDAVKGQIRGLRTSALPVAPTAVAEKETPAQVVPNVQQMMDQHKELTAQAEPMEQQLQEAAAKGDTAKINELVPRYQALQEQLTQLGSSIEGLGGTTKTPELFESDAAKELKALDKKIKAAQKNLTGASEEGDFAALPSLASKLDELKAQKAQLDAQFNQQRETLRVNQIPVGETIPLLKPEEMPEQPATVKPKEAGAGPLDLEKEPKPGIVHDLFGDFNLLNTAIQNRDERTLEAMRRARENADRRAKEDTKTEAERVSEMLDARVGRIIRRERNFDVREIKTGPNAGQEVYVSDDINAEVKRLRNLVEKPIGNAKRSLLQQAHDEYAAIEELEKRLETGIAKPLTAERVEELKAKFGKAEAPAARQMNAGEVYQTKRSLAAAKKKYEMTLGKIKKVRDQVEAELAKLHTQTEKPGFVAQKKQKQAELEALGRSERQMSREAKTAKRINEGNVRKEAEASQKMRDLARDLGFEEEEYQKLGRSLQKRMDALVAKYGKGDPRVDEFYRKTSEDLIKKAIEIGKKTPEYKAVLKEQTKLYAESVKSAGAQEIKSKRTAQEVRKLPKLGAMKTGSPESMERSKQADEGLRRKMTPKDKARLEKDFKEGMAFRTAKTGEAVVDPTEAKARIVEIKSKMPKGMNLIYEPTLEGMKPETLAMLKAEGYKEGTGFKGVVLSDGTIVVVGDQHADMKDLEETLFHEMVGHYGIDTVIGHKILKEFAHATDLEKLARKLGGEKLWHEAVAAMNFAVEQKGDPDLAALREIIAYTAQQRITENFREKAGRWLQQLVGMVRSALRSMGFKNMSEMSTSDVFYAIKQANKAYNARTLGPYRAADGTMAFRTKSEPSRYGRSFVAKEKSAKDKLLGNMLGLSGRVQYVDQFAALDEAFKKGLSAGVISDLEAEQAQYYMRFAPMANSYATQAISNGPLSLVKQMTKRGAEFIFKSTPGASLIKVADALQKSGIKNGTELEAMFTIYMAGKRAKQVGWEKLNFEMPAEAKAEHDQLMEELRGNDKARAAFEEAARIYKEYNNGLLDFLVQTGYLGKDKAAELKRIDYVPFYRADANGNLNLFVDKEHPVRIANIKDEPMLHELVGDNTQILPIFTSSAQNAFVLTRMGLRNQMMKDSSMLLKRMGIASKIGKGAGPKGAGTVRYKVNGEDNFAVIDSDKYGVPAELIVKGMEGVKTTIPLAIKLMGKPANVLRHFVTRNPAYAVRQVIRDPLTAWLTTGSDGIPVINSMKELATMVAGRSETERKLMESGAISSNVLTGGEEDMAKALREVSMGKSNWAKAMAKLDAIAMQGDAATRAVVYKDSIAKGMSDMQALTRTLESMNFSRRGLSPSIQMLSTVIPFFNAQIQGLDVLYRAFKGQMPYSEQLKIREKLYMRGLLIAAATLAYAAAMEDDEAYKTAKPEERLGNWFVYTPFAEEPLKIPIPFELGYLFKSLPEAVWNMASKDERANDVTKGMTKLLGMSNPFSLPQAIKPLTEVVLGKSFFGGDIESQREQTQMLPTERAREGTSEIAKLLGSVTGNAGLTPIKIDYLIRGYTGALGAAIASLANPILNTETSQVEKPTMKASKTPFIGGLFQPVEGRGTLDAAYERMLEIQQAQGTFKRLAEEGKPEEARAFLEEYRNKIANAALSGAVQQQLGELASMKRQVVASKKTTAEKDELLKKIELRQQAIARRFLEVTG